MRNIAERISLIRYHTSFLSSEAGKAYRDWLDGCEGDFTMAHVDLHAVVRNLDNAVESMTSLRNDMAAARDLADEHVDPKKLTRAA